MAIFVGAVLGLLSIAVLVYPFFKLRTTARPQGEPPNADDAGPELESIYEAIRTLQLEHQLGKIPEGLYQEQLNGYRVEAALVLKQQMEAQDQDPAWALEQEVLVARASLASVNGQATCCPNCGTVVTAGLIQCPECNVSLGSAGPDAQGAAQQ